MTFTRIQDLAFEIDGDDISIEQDYSGNVDRVILHRIHLRHLAEQAGLVAAGGYANSDSVIARLSRQMRLLHGRIKHMDECLWAVAGYGREDLDHECSYSTATLDLVDEFVADLPVTLSALAQANTSVTEPATVEGGADGSP